MNRPRVPSLVFPVPRPFSLSCPFPLPRSRLLKSDRCKFAVLLVSLALTLLFTTPSRPLRRVRDLSGPGRPFCLSSGKTPAPQPRSSSLSLFVCSRSLSLSLSLSLSGIATRLGPSNSLLGLRQHSPFTTTPYEWPPMALGPHCVRGSRKWKASQRSNRHSIPLRALCHISQLSTLASNCIENLRGTRGYIMRQRSTRTPRPGPYSLYSSESDATGYAARSNETPPSLAPNPHPGFTS